MISAPRYYVAFTLILSAIGILSDRCARASQLGFALPTHRFPTDTSFHAAFGLGFGSSNSNYTSTGARSPLSNTQSIGWQKNSVQVEYQPSNNFAIGGNFAFQRTTLDNTGSNTSTSHWSLGDQTIFGEYRFVDAPGYSLGIAGVVKFPGYFNDTVADAQANAYTILAGDGQSDLGALVTAEFWPANVIRIQGDFGYLFRTQSFADQLLYQGSIGFVIPRVDFSLRILGYHSIGNGPTPGSSFESEISTLRGLFADSNFAYSPMPSLLMFSPKVEFWIGPEYAISATYTKTLRGTEAAVGSYFEFGFIYRFSERKQNTRRNFTEVDIKTDQSSGVFEGELQEESQTPNTRKRATPQPSQNLDFEPLYYEPAE